MISVLNKSESQLYYFLLIYNLIISSRTRDRPSNTVVFKCLHGLPPPYLCKMFKTRSEVHNRNTTYKDRLHIPLCRTAAGQRAFTFRGQRLWNNLPDKIQSIITLENETKATFFK